MRLEANQPPGGLDQRSSEPWVACLTNKARQPTCKATMKTSIAA